MTADAVVVGSGPNGLGAAVTLAAFGLRVTVFEADETIGGGARSAEATLPGFVHDLCSAIHPLGVASPLFRSLPLAAHGLEWVHPGSPLAHPLDARSAAVLSRSLDETADALGADGPSYRALMRPLVDGWDAALPDLLGSLRAPARPLALLPWAWSGLRSASGLARHAFAGVRGRALFAGLAAHSVIPLERLPSAAIGLVLGAAAHVSGWPLPRGGAGRITDALISLLHAWGGEVVGGFRVRSLHDLPPAHATLLDLTPAPALEVAGALFPPRYRRALERYRYGPGVFKLDWALSEPIPWHDPACAAAGTLHLGGTLEEVAAAERAPWRGAHAERPFVLLAQPSRFDPTRAPEGGHTAWGYCHVPTGSELDVGDRIEAQVERFAPGFRDCVLARAVAGPVTLERRNPNLVGGDIGGGAADGLQLFLRPAPRLVPHATPVPGLYLCSSATPPGGGVHGMCGFHAARAALFRTFGMRVPADPRRALAGRAARAAA